MTEHVKTEIEAGIMTLTAGPRRQEERAEQRHV